MSVEQDIYNMAMEKLAIFDDLKRRNIGAWKDLTRSIRNAWKVRKAFMNKTTTLQNVTHEDLKSGILDTPMRYATGEQRREDIRRFNDTAADFLQARTNEYDRYLHSAPYVSKPKSYKRDDYHDTDRADLLYDAGWEPLVKGQRRYDIMMPDARRNPTRRLQVPYEGNLAWLSYVRKFYKNGIPQDEHFVDPYGRRLFSDIGYLNKWGPYYSWEKMKNYDHKKMVRDYLNNIRLEDLEIVNPGAQYSPKDVEQALRVYFNGRHALEHYINSDARNTAIFDGSLRMPAKIEGDTWDKANRWDNLRADWQQTARDLENIKNYTIPNALKSVFLGPFAAIDAVVHPIRFFKNPIKNFKNSVEWNGIWSRSLDD